MMAERKVYANKSHLMTWPTKHVVAVVKVLDAVTRSDTPNLEELSWADEERESLRRVRDILQISAENAELDMSVRCDQCGRQTGMDTGVCGMCAEDFNTNPPEVGRKRINRRRAANGLDPMVWEERP